MGTTYKFETAAIWLDGISLVGHVKEFELPDMEWDTTDHEALAFRGISEYPQRMQALEATLTWADFTQELANAAADPWAAVKLQIRANYGAYEGGSKTSDVLRVVTLSGRFKSNSLGSLSQGEFERESVMTCDYVREQWDGQDVFEFGVNPPIYRVGAGSTDLFAVLRSNLGI